MEDRPIAPKDVPRNCDIVELVYRIQKTKSTHLDLVLSVDGVDRSLRFIGPRVVQFEKELPDLMHGIEVQDIASLGPAGLSLWVSVGEGAVTFWAKEMVERVHPERRVRVFENEPLRPWELQGSPVESYNYQMPRGGSFRAFSITTKPYEPN
jgi:hypothetical protein